MPDLQGIRDRRGPHLRMWENVPPVPEFPRVSQSGCRAFDREFDPSISWLAEQGSRRRSRLSETFLELCRDPSAFRVLPDTSTPGETRRVLDMRLWTVQDMN